MTNKIIIKIAGIVMLITGLGHLITHFLVQFSQNPHPELEATMATTFLEIGSKVSVLDLHNGFSLAMGILLAGFGIQILRSRKRIDLIFHSILAAIILLISFLYFPLFVVVLITASFGFLIISLFKSKEI